MDRLAAPPSTVRILPGRCGSPVVKAAMDLRAAVLAAPRRSTRQTTIETGMMQACSSARTSSSSASGPKQYRNTGTFHVLVISGTHVAILAAFFLFLLRICFVPERPALAITVLAAWLYALVTGWGAPCVRSAAGLTLVTVCRYFYRERRPINLLAAVALAFLVFDPEQLFDSSFQLTFLAVAFLGAVRHASDPRHLRAAWPRTGGAGRSPAATCTWRRAWPSSASKCASWRRRCGGLCGFPRARPRLAVTVPARRAALFLGGAAGFGGGAGGHRAPHGGLFSPHRDHRAFRPTRSRCRSWDWRSRSGSSRWPPAGGGWPGSEGGCWALAGDRGLARSASSRTGASPCRRCGWRWPSRRP